MYLLMAICEQISFAINIDKRKERNYSGKLFPRLNLASEGQSSFVVTCPTATTMIELGFRMI